MFRELGKLFLRGLAAVLPLGLTIYIVWWLGSSAESAMGAVIRYILPEGSYWPGMGLVAGVGLVLGAGVLTQAWLVRRLFKFGEDLLNKIPLVKTLYGSVRDLMNFFAGPEKTGIEQVVMVELTEGGPRLLGFVTRDDAAGLPGGAEPNADRVAVYLPMSYQVGGFMAVVPKSSLRPVQMSIEDGMRYAVTAGLSGAAR
jgi:uncharacterized membrane protein